LLFFRAASCRLHARRAIHGPGGLIFARHRAACTAPGPSMAPCSLFLARPRSACGSTPVDRLLGLLHHLIQFWTAPDVEPPEPLEKLAQVLDGGVPKDLGLAVMDSP